MSVDRYLRVKMADIGCLVSMSVKSIERESWWMCEEEYIQNCSRLVCAASSGNLLWTFRNNLKVPY